MWTEVHDELLCREIIGVDVFTRTKKGKTKRSAKWAKVVENLSNVEAAHFGYYWMLLIQKHAICYC